MTPTAPQSRYYQQHSMATTGWWSWLVIHTSHINPQNLFKRWILLILLPFMLVIQKKPPNPATRWSTGPRVNPIPCGWNPPFRHISIMTFPSFYPPRSTPGDPGAWHVRQQGLDAHVAARGVATKNHPAACDILHPAGHAEICGESCGFS